MYFLSELKWENKDERYFTETNFQINQTLTVRPLTEPEKKAFQGWYVRPNMFASMKAAALETVSLTLVGVSGIKIK